MLVLTRKVNESITIQDNISVSVLEVKGNQVRLGIKAPDDIQIHRTEIYESILAENIRASKTPHDLAGFQDVFKIIGSKKQGGES